MGMKRPNRQLIDTRPISRRKAFKIYNRIRLLTELETLDATVPHLTIEDAAKLMGRTRAEIRQIIKYPGISGGLFMRVLAEVERDIYCQKRRPHRWRRYKIGERYRSTAIGKEICGLQTTFHAVMNGITELSDEEFEKIIA